MSRRPAVNIRYQDIQKKYRPSRGVKLCRRLAAVALLPVLASGIPSETPPVDIPRPDATGNPPAENTTANDVPAAPSSAPAPEPSSAPAPEPAVSDSSASSESAPATSADAPYSYTETPVAAAAGVPPEQIDNSGGYYPTQQSQALTGGLTRENDPRRGPNTIPFMDADGPYLHDGREGFSTLDRAWAPVQSMVGYLIPRETNLWSGESGRLSANLQPGLPYLTDIESNRLPLFKAGPLYIDIIWIGATAIYSDLEADAEYPDDGFIASIDLKFRTSLRLADGVYLSAATSIYYLPQTNEVGFYFFDQDHTFARLMWETSAGQWDFQIYDEFQVLHRLTDMFAPVENNEIDVSGRYRLGRVDEVGLSINEYDQEELVVFRNTIGARATRPLGSDFRLWLDADHYDYWHTTDFEDHHQAARFRAQLFYERDWRFTPYVGYSALTSNGYEGFSHEVYTGAIGYITPRLRFHGRVGYLWQDEYNDIERDGGVTWSTSLTYDQSEWIRHMLTVGSVHWMSDFGEEYFSDFARYAIQTRFPFDPLSGSFGRYSTAGAYVQYSDTEYWDTPPTTIESIQVGANFTMPIGNRAHFALTGAYRTDESDDPIEDERWLYRASLHWRLGLRTSANLSFQHEDVSRIDGNLEEDMILFQIRRTF